MKVKHESYEKVGIFTISGNMTVDHEDNLKLLLMKAVNGLNRAVLNLKGVKNITGNCLKLLNKAYCTSLRLKNPIIMIEVPETYQSKIFSCKSLTSDFVLPINKAEMDSGKGGVLSGVN